MTTRAAGGFCPAPQSGTRLARGVPAATPQPGAWVEAKGIGYPTNRWLNQKVTVFEALREGGIRLEATARGRCGSYGCIYNIDGRPGVVAKITGDLSEAAAAHAAIVARRGGARFPALSEIFCVYGVKGTRLWVIFQEELAPISREEKAFLAKYAWRMKAAAAGDSDAYDHVREAVSAAAGAVTFRDVDAVIGTIRALRKAGILWNDLHNGNILATKAGHWRIIDLGVSRVQDQRVPRLGDVFARAMAGFERSG